MAVRYGLKANKALAKKASPIGPGLVAIDLLKNPWHAARERADKTGVVVADLLARTNAERYVIIGHSLGARVAAVATEQLATKNDGPTIQTTHLLGGAITAKGDWQMLDRGVESAVHNYHSTNDKVLRFLYTTAQAGRTPVGLRGFRSSFSRIKDHDVSRLVKGHSEYVDHVRLA